MRQRIISFQYISSPISICLGTALKTNRQAQRDIPPYGFPATAVYESSGFELERVSASNSDQGFFFFKNSAEFGLSISTVLIAAVQAWDHVESFIAISRIFINYTLRFFKLGYMKSVYIIALPFFHLLLLCLQIWVPTLSLANSLWLVVSVQEHHLHSRSFQYCSVTFIDFFGNSP